MLSKLFLLRFASFTLMFGFALTLAPITAHAKYARPDLINIPIERLIKNLEELAMKNPKDAMARFNLARANAMAYALKSDTAQVRKNNEQEGAWFGYEPTHVPFPVKQTDDANKLKNAQEYLSKAISRYEEVIKLDPTNLPAALGHAWCVDQSGEKKIAIKEYRKVIGEAWKKEKDLKVAGLGWRSITAETAGYLIPLLDPNTDQEEISTLKNRTTQMKGVLRPITPVVVPLRDGMTAGDLEDRSANVAFDADGTGQKKNWSWITKDAGWLVYDPHGTGRVTSALQLFGGVSFWMFWDNGYQALAALDDNGDGLLTKNELRGLAIWKDINSNGISEPGEVKALSEWNIAGISCRYLQDLKHQGQIAYSPQGVFFRDGSTRPTYDIILQPR